MEIVYFGVVLWVGVWIGNSLGLSEEVGRMILGIGVDFVACE